MKRSNVTMERLSKVSDRPCTRKMSLVAVMLVCMLAMVFVPTMVPDENDADTYGPWTYDLSGNYVIITGYNASSATSVLVIPAVIDGKDVIQVGKPTEPDGPGKIVITGGDASVVETIEFERPSNVGTIAKAAFDDFTGLKELYIPETVMDIFTISCPSLEKIIVHSDNTEFESDDSGILYKKDTSTTTITYTIQTCPRMASSAVIPSDMNVVEIDSDAFKGCAELTSFSIPAKVTTIGANAFEGCSSLTSITGGAALTTIGASAFKDCSKLATFAPQKVTSIGDNAFEGCVKLNNVSFASIKTIGQYGFKGCKALTSFKIGSGVTSVGEGVFEGCESLATIEGGSTTCPVTNGILYSQEKIDGVSVKRLICCPAGKTGSVTVADNTVIIAESAFYGCKNITSVELPETVNKICKKAFYGCNSLESVTSWLDSQSKVKIEQDDVDKTFEKTNTGTKIVTDFRGLSTVNGDFDDGAQFRLIKNIGNNVYTYFKEDSPYYDLYIVTHGTGTAKIDFGELGEKPWDAEPSLTPGADYGWNNSLKLNVDKVIEIGGVLNIPDDTFNGFKYLAEVEGFASTTTVGDYAFYQCVTLSTISLPKATSMGEYAFSKCLTLRTVNIPAMTSMGQYAFFECNNLEQIALKSKVNEIKEGTFKDCAHLTKAEMSYVTTIGEDAFRGCESLTEVSFASNTSIGSYAFSGCSKLTDMPQANILKIGSYAFKGCESIKSLNLSTVTDIGTEAFLDCKGISTVDFKASATLDGSVFDGCDSIKSFAVTGKGTYYAESGVLMRTTTVEKKSVKELYRYPAAAEGSYTVPETIERIADYAFSHTDNLTELVIGSKVTYVGMEALSYCKNLEKVIIWAPACEAGTGVLLESDGALVYTATDDTCTKFRQEVSPSERVQPMDKHFGENLYDFTVTKADGETLYIYGSGAMYSLSSGAHAWSGVKYVVMSDEITSIGSHVFEGCINMEQITIPKGVTIIEKCAFKDCEKLSSVSLNAALKEIRAEAFSGTALKAVDVPSSVTKIGDKAFADCNSNDDPSLAQVNIPSDSSLTSIGSKAFAGSVITSFTIPKNLSEMGDNPFVSHDKLKTINNLSQNFDITAGILYDKDKTRVICGLSDISTDYVMPSTVKGVDSYAFWGCKNLKSVEFSADLETIGEKAFENCVSIPDVTLNESLKTIGSSAFKGCTGIKTIMLPESVTSIGASAFAGCTGVELAVLKCLVSDSKKVSVGASAFTDVPIGTIYATEKIRQAINDSGYAYANTKVLVACGDSVYGYVFKKGDVYSLNIIGTGNMEDKFTWGWGNEGSITVVEIEDGVTKLGDNVFKGLTVLTSIEFPDSITAIPEYAFSGCVLLKDVCLNKVVTIEKYAFDGCAALTGTLSDDSVFTISKNVKEIQYKAFFNSGIKKIIFDGNVTLGGSAFPGDYSVMLENGLTKTGLYDYVGGEWIDNNHKVIWIVEGKVTDTQRVKDGDPVPEYKGVAPTKEATKQYYYTFQNWTPSDVTTVTDDIIFKAVFMEVKQKYTVEYKDSTTGQSSIDTSDYGVYYLKDNMLSVPAGKLFGCWTINGVEMAERAQITLEQNTTVFAKWIDNYTVTYDPGLHGTGSIEPVKTTGSITLPEATAFTAEAGWQFVGWNVDGKTYDAGAKITVKKSLTITALWEGKYVMTYKAGTYGIGQEYAERFALSITLADNKFAPMTEQYYFIGWNIDGKLVDAGTTLENVGNSVAYAEWGTKNTVTYDKTEGSGTMNVDYVVKGNPYVLKDCNFTAPYTYAFKGWDVDGDIMQPGMAIIVSSDVIIKAVWELGVSISFYANGGTGNMADVYVLYNSPYVPGECKFIAPEGKVFDAWSIDGRIVEIIPNVVEPVSLRAEWKNLYTVTIDPNGGIGESFDEYVKDSFTFPTADDCWFEAPAGQAFYAWSYDGAEYQPGDMILVSKNITIKAIWKANYTVTFDANGGTGEMAPMTTFGSFVVPQCGFTAPAGDPMAFKNWALPNGTTVKAGETIAVTENTVLKAVWVPAYKVTFAANGGTGEMAPVNASGEYELPECEFKPATEDKVFDLWLLPDGTVAAPGMIIDVIGDMTVTATWTTMYSVKVSGNSYGTASADVKYAMPGDTVRLTKTPSAGCDFVSWEVTPSTLKIVNDKFEMPNQDVTVKAIFKVHVDSEISAEIKGVGSVSIPLDSQITTKCWIDLSMYKITSPKQSNIPKDATVYNVSIDVYNGTQKMSVSGKTATVFIAYKLASGEKADDLKVYFVSDDGRTVQDMNATYDAVKGGMIFTTTHFSDYVITHEEIKPIGTDYMPILLAIVIAVLIIIFALLLAWRHKLNSC